MRSRRRSPKSWAKRPPTPSSSALSEARGRHPPSHLAARPCSPRSAGFQPARSPWSRTSHGGTRYTSLRRPCINAQVPFTGGAGQLLDQAFSRADVVKSQIFITSVVHCHPQNNRPSLPHEIANCADYLADELRIPHPRLIIGLGGDARVWLEGWAGRDYDDWQITKRALHATVPRERILQLAPHPSWVMKQPKPVRDDYVETLAASLRWAFDN